MARGSQPRKATARGLEGSRPPVVPPFERSRDCAVTKLLTVPWQAWAPRRALKAGGRRPGLMAGYALAWPSLLPLPMVTFLGCTSGFFGMSMESTPSFIDALTLFGSMPSGRVKLRVKVP